MLLLLYYNACMYYIMHTCINDMLICIHVLYYHIVLYYSVIITHPRDAEWNYNASDHRIIREYIYFTVCYATEPDLLYAKDYICIVEYKWEMSSSGSMAENGARVRWRATGKAFVKKFAMFLRPGTKMMRNWCCFTRSRSQWNRISSDFDIFKLMLSLVRPMATSLSQKIGVGGWG